MHSNIEVYNDVLESIYSRNKYLCSTIIVQIPKQSISTFEKKKKGTLYTCGLSAPERSSSVQSFSFLNCPFTNLIQLSYNESEEMGTVIEIIEFVNISIHFR
jgi:hypothetical protein